MKTPKRFHAYLLVAALLVVLSSAGIAAAQTGLDTCVGKDATLGGTCTPLTNTTSGNNQNSAFGYLALSANTTGEFNTATGVGALRDNTTGISNTATGNGALVFNTSGSSNTAIGQCALCSPAFTGSDNIGIGNDGGSVLTSGSSNIDIGSQGVAGDDSTIRVGTQGTQSATFVAGIYKEKVGKKHCDVLVDSEGKLGCEVSGAVDTSMLLKELQKQAAQIAEMKTSLRQQAAELKVSHERELAMRAAFEERLSRLEQAAASNDGNRRLAAAFNR